MKFANRPDEPGEPSFAALKPPPPVPLRRNLRFQALWVGQSCATLGMRIGDTAFPLLVLALTGSSTAAGAFGAVEMATALLLGVHGAEQG